jgi:hypothetical protein
MKTLCGIRLWITGKGWIVPNCFTSRSARPRIINMALQRNQGVVARFNRKRRRSKANGGMTEVTKNSASEPRDPVSATPHQKPGRRPKKERSLSSRKDDLLLNAQVHQVTVQGMQVSLPWLRFMARREG